MFQQKILIFVCSFCLFAGVCNAGMFESLEIAQGDGDPREMYAQERLFAEKKLADDDVATVTAEGDFVVPSYLLQTVDELPIDDSVQISTVVERDLPIVVVKQTEVTPVVEQMEVERRLTGSSAQTQKIYSDALRRQQPTKQKMGAENKNVVQKQVAVENITVAQKQPVVKNKPIQPVKKEVLKSADDDINAILAGEYQSEKSSVENKKPLLLPLKGTQKVVKKTVDETLPKPRMKTYSSIYADKIIEAVQTNEKLPLIMPMDLKVTFYPNASDFSGKTIKWIKAFSYKALQDPRYVIQIRLSKEDPYLQEKRLYLVQKILAGSGLSSHQMVVDYVERPKDSLILRMVRKEPNLGSKFSDKNKKIINW